MYVYIYIILQLGGDGTELDVYITRIHLLGTQSKRGESLCAKQIKRQHLK